MCAKSGLYFGSCVLKNVKEMQSFCGLRLDVSVRQFILTLVLS